MNKTSACILYWVLVFKYLIRSNFSGRKDLFEFWFEVIGYPSEKAWQQEHEKTGM